MEDKNYYEELMEEYDTWSELVKDLIKDRLYQYEDVDVYACDLPYTLFEGENVDGSFTYSTYWSKELIKHYWDDFEELSEYYEMNVGEKLNPLESAEKFVVIMLIEQASNILGSNSYINQNWDNMITLDKKTIEEIIECM